MSSITVPEKENLFSKLKNIKNIYILFGTIVFLTIILFTLIYYFFNSKRATEIVFVVIFLSILFAGGTVVLLQKRDKSESDSAPVFKTFLIQISPVFYALIYTISIIIYFQYGSYINTYPYIIVPIIVCLGIFCFYKSFSKNYIEDYDVNYERIKTLILFFCLIITFISFYNNDPGGYVTKYFGGAFLIATLIGVFSILYLIIVMMLPDNGPKSSDKNLISQKYSTFSIVINCCFVCFIVFIFLLGFFDTKIGKSDENNTQTYIRGFGIVIVVFLLFLWAILLCLNIFPENTNKNKDNVVLNSIKRMLMTLFAISVSVLFILWITISIENLSGRSSTVSFILNLIIIIIVLGLVYKTINTDPDQNKKNNKLSDLVLSILFYVPCFFIGIFDKIGSLFMSAISSTKSFGNKKIIDTKSAVKPTENNLPGSILMLVVALSLILVYFKMPSVFNIINTQGGKQLVNRPVNTNTLYALGTYADLNESEKFDYQYAISFWVFINSAPPNLNPNYNNFVSILNFGGKPNVLYNGRNNTLMITMTEEGNAPDKKNKNVKLIDYDDNGNRIIYVNNNFLLQKWNNIIINYSGGVLDIFLNSELVKSNRGIVPYYTLDNLTIGTDEGIEGGICNVVYFRRPLTTSNIFYLYNMIKDRSPPVLNDSNKTILVENVNKTVSSIT